MHSHCLVVGDSPKKQLEPFADWLEVEKYKSYMTSDDIEMMAEEFSLHPTDLRGLAARMGDWHEAEGGVDGDRLFFWTTENPRAKFDWYEVGGRFSDSLVLRKPLEPSWWGKILGRKPRTGVSQARRCEVLEEPILSRPPVVFLNEGEWHEAPLTLDDDDLEDWNQGFPSLFAPVAGEAMLTVIDLHS